jgi:putative nucleotidyltransferase with HDIG domain
MLPIASLALLSRATLKRQLEEQTHERLVAHGRAAGLRVQRRLLDARAELQSHVFRGTMVTNGEVSPVMASVVRIVGHIPAAADPYSGDALDVSELRRLEAGLTVLRTDQTKEGVTRVWLGVARPGGEPVWGEVEPSYLWTALSGREGQEAELLCVLGQRGEPLLCPPNVASPITAADPSSRQWRRGGETYAAAAQSLPMQHEFGVSWSVIASERTSLVYAPMAQFRRAHLLTIAGALVLVALVSVIGVRHTMTPLSRLTAATSRLAVQDFGQRVEITSNDEFRDLAVSFNAMSNKLHRQFGAMQGIVDLGQRLLAARDNEAIAQAALESATRILPCRSAALLLLRMPGVSAQTQYWCFSHGHMTKGSAANALQMLPDHAPDAPIVLSGSEPGYADLPVDLRAWGAATIMMLPVRLAGRPTGALLFGLDTPMRAEDALFARQLGDYAAVALSNAKLVRELHDLNWGALRTLARAIDAKSSWTAGHSDRVTALSLGLGRRMGLDAVQLEKLERGGLLHDVGKIGVPAEILDKPGALTSHEWDVMRSHPTLGGRILEPIGRYADVIPIVLYHHERWDGGGYPQGLAGEAIPLLARVLAVGDVFDALTSERPYRPGMDVDTAVAIIQQGFGTHFDQRIAEEFVAMVREGDVAEILRTIPGAAIPLFAAVAAVA